MFLCYEIQNKCSAAAKMGDRARAKWAEKWGRGLLCHFQWGELGPHLTTTSPGPRPTALSSYILTHPAIWPQQTCAENWRGLCPFLGGRAGSPSNTMWAGQRPTSILSGILIHPAIWTQYTWAEKWEGSCCAPFREGRAGHI